MNISLKGEYALHAIFDLASRSHADPVKIADIAKRQKIPQKFLELILSSLKQGGFVESRRGADGGYLLARAPESITVGEVLRFIEGGKTRQAGRASQADAFADLWAQIESATSRVIDRTSFAEVVQSWRDRQSKYVPNWDI